MIQHCPVLIVLLPLTAALLCLLFSKFNKNLGSWLVIGSIAGSLACSLQVLHQTLTSGEAIHYWMGNWEPPLGIEFVIDPLSAVMAVLITFISLMVARLVRKSSDSTPRAENARRTYITLQVKYIHFRTV